MNKPKYDLAKLETQFKMIQPICVQYSEEITRQLSKLISEANVKLAFPIQFRAKTWESFVNKLNQGRFAISSSILEMQDLVGFRIILLFKQDVDKVSEVIKKSFKVINEYNTEDKLQDNQFGYVSKHIITELNDEWLKLPTMQSFKGIKCEVQVRTLSQHSWAEVSHIFQYKDETNVPKPLKRSISRISALLETVDLEFERLLNERLIYIEDVGMNPIQKQELNADLLEKILDDLFPSQNKSTIFAEEFSMLLRELEDIEIVDSENLIGIIKDYLSQAMVIEQNRVKRINSKNKPNAIEYYYNHSGLLRIIIALFKKDIEILSHF